MDTYAAAALGVGSNFGAVPVPKKISGVRKVKLQMPNSDSVVAFDDLKPEWQAKMKGKFLPKQPVIVKYNNPDSDDNMKPLFYAERLQKRGYNSNDNYEDKNSLEYVAGQPQSAQLTVDKLLKAGDKGVVHRYRFSVIGYIENNNDHVAMKNMGEKIEKYGGEYGALIIDQKLLEQALTEAAAIGRELMKSSSTNDYYIVTPSKNNNKILEKYEKFEDLVSTKVGVGKCWADGGYSDSTANGALRNGHITQEGMKWKEVYLRKFNRNDGSLKKWLAKIGNDATRYEDIETDKERLNELLEVEIAQYYLYIINDEKINEKTVQLPKNLSVEPFGTFGNATKVCGKLGVTSGRKQQDIHEKLEKKNLKMAGHGPNTKTWAKGTEVAEEAWCVLEIKGSTYLVRGSELV